MGFLDIFIDLWYVFMIPPLVISGFILGTYFSSARKTQVIKRQIGSLLGAVFDVIEENNVYMYCKGFGFYPPQRYAKTGHPIIANRRGFLGRTVKQTLYLGREGTAYTTDMDDEEKRISLPNTIRTVWGDTFYKTIPKEQLDQIENSKLNVIVDLKKESEAEESGRVKVSEENVNDEQDRRFFTNMFMGAKSAIKHNYVMLFAFLGAGAFMATMIFMFTGHLT